ncbi:AI-2E family transporter YdiK [Azonexus sp.]|jgi:predicted PurR-regulated permease PerM|uniref:AI-2E family transporter YdiK n=1 Tax=Azonexus sp. TaxID=1872668 RepID=UPI00282FF58D|nr:AI-2E family transporter YdiK [Azonexus sp.]MDR1996607.1 AI-2E family transporter YdiK [Azonexus sp.]
MNDIHHDLPRKTLAILCILGLIGLSLWVLRPFLAATVWAAMIVVATWPWLRSLEARFGGRRAPAVALMCLVLLILLVLPLWLAIDTIVEYADVLATTAHQIAENGLPPPPDWLAGVPLVGERLAALWLQFSAGGAPALVAKITPHAADTGKWVLARVGGLGGMLVQFLLIVVLSAILYTGGEDAARLLRRFGRRLAGVRGEGAIVLSSQAIRAVALGVGVTALTQAVLGGIGLAVAGVPFAALLSAVMLLLCIAQLGPGLILFPAVAWMYWNGDSGWATALLVWSLIVVMLDNVLRPILIRKGADLPLLLIFAGVIGGLLGFGLIGIFVGPVVLAVTWTLTLAWIEDVLGKDEAELVGEGAPPVEPGNL